MFRGVCHWPHMGINYGTESDQGVKTEWKLFKWTDLKQRWWNGWDGIFVVKNYTQEQVKDIKIWLFDNMREHRYKLCDDISWTGGRSGMEIYFKDRNDAMMFRMWLSD